MKKLRKSAPYTRVRHALEIEANSMERDCEFCGEPFTARPSKQRFQRYCTPICRYRLHNMKRVEENLLVAKVAPKKKKKDT